MPASFQTNWMAPAAFPVSSIPNEVALCILAFRHTKYTLQQFIQHALYLLLLKNFSFFHYHRFSSIPHILDLRCKIYLWFFWAKNLAIFEIFSFSKYSRDKKAQDERQCCFLHWMPRMSWLCLSHVQPQLNKNKWSKLYQGFILINS